VSKNQKKLDLDISLENKKQKHILDLTLKENTIPLKG